MMVLLVLVEVWFLLKMNGWRRWRELKKICGRIARINYWAWWIGWWINNFLKVRSWWWKRRAQSLERIHTVGNADRRRSVEEHWCLMNADLLLTFYIYRRRRPVQNADVDEHFSLSAAFYLNKIFHKIQATQHHEHFLWKAALYVPLNFFFCFTRQNFSFCRVSSSPAYF